MGRFVVHFTLVIGASRGNEDNLAKLVRLKPSDATERMSKLHRLIECNDPLGASFACGTICNVSLASTDACESKTMTKCVGVLYRQDTYKKVIAR